MTHRFTTPLLFGLFVTECTMRDRFVHVRRPGENYTNERVNVGVIVKCHPDGPYLSGSWVILNGMQPKFAIHYFRNNGIRRVDDVLVSWAPPMALVPPFDRPDGPRFFNTAEKLTIEWCNFLCEAISNNRGPPRTAARGEAPA